MSTLNDDTTAHSTATEARSTATDRHDLARLVSEEGPAALRGRIVTGTVRSVQEYGAFVDVPVGDRTLAGMVHVSEVAETFVDNIWAHVGEGDEVEVAVLQVRSDGKVDLSMKRADPDWLDDDVPDLRPKDGKEFNRMLRGYLHRAQRSNGLRRRQRRQRLGMRPRR